MKKTFLPILSFVILSAVTITSCKKGVAKPVQQQNNATSKPFTTTTQSAAPTGQNTNAGSHQCGGGSHSNSNGAGS